jgi:transposase-like protein
MNKFSLTDFDKRFKTDDACLEEIKNLRWPNGITCPKCKKITKFYRVTDRTAYACEFCGTHIYPLAGTIFEKTSTSLKSWFFAMYLMTQTRAGISAKQLERMLGVTYKTAWRMARQIRLLMAETNPTLLTGNVEIDETFIGGKGRSRAYKWTAGVEQKEIVMGMVQRKGKAYLKHIPNSGKWTLLKQIKDHVDPRAHVITDELPAYKNIIIYGYTHDSVHHRAREYVVGDIHTQSIENIWSHLKRGIYGVYRVVSKKYLQAYVDEFAFRYNNRFSGGKMFDVLLEQVATVTKADLPA